MKNIKIVLLCMFFLSMAIGSASIITAFPSACPRCHLHTMCDCCKYDKLSFEEKIALGLTITVIEELSRNCSNCRSHNHDDSYLSRLKDQTKRAKREVESLRSDLDSIQRYCFPDCHSSWYLRRVRCKQEEIARAEESLARAQERYASALRDALYSRNRR